jgi:hypothetical protein
MVSCNRYSPAFWRSLGKSEAEELFADSAGLGRDSKAELKAK